MNGDSRLTLHGVNGEQYIVTNPNIYARGILIGSMYMEIGDSMTIKCEATGLEAVLEFKTKGYFTGTMNTVEGFIRPIGTSDERYLYRITGKWTDKIYIQASSVTWSLLTGSCRENPICSLT